MTLKIRPQELDVALKARRLRLGQGTNGRDTTCVNAACAKPIPLGLGRSVFLDGHRRGFACADCQQAFPSPLGD